MSSAGFEPDNAGAKRIQPFPLETTTHGIYSIGYKLIHENFINNHQGTAMHSIETLKNLLNSGASLRIDANNALIL